jgi:hypothetical protein
MAIVPILVDTYPPSSRNNIPFVHPEIFVRPLLLRSGARKVGLGDMRMGENASGGLLSGRYDMNCLVT